MESFTIVGWRNYQRYTDRLPKWIAIYSTIRDDLDVNAINVGEPPITDAEMGQILGIFCLATRLDRPDKMPNGPDIPMNPKWVQKKAGLDSAPDLKRLVSIGLLSCNKMLQDVPVNCENLYLTGQDRTGQDKTKDTNARVIAPEAYEMAALLAEKIRERDPLAKLDGEDKWADHIERIVRIDGRTWDQVRDVLLWSQNHNFWRNNIRSGFKLRKQFSVLVAKKQDEQPQSSQPLQIRPYEKEWSEDVEVTAEDRRAGEAFLERLRGNGGNR